MADGRWHALVRRVSGWRSVVVGLLGLYATWSAVQRFDEHYAIGDWLAWRVLLLWIYTLAFQVACVGLGHVALRRIAPDDERPVLERWLFSMAIGLVAFVLAMFLLGAIAAFHPWATTALLLAFIVAGARDLRRLVGVTLRDLRTPADPPEPAWVVAWRRIACAWGVLCFGILYAICFTPDAIGFDASWYHLPIAQDYARMGRLVRFPSDYTRAFPHGASLVYTWAYLMPGIESPFHWMLALHLEFSMVVWKAVGVAVAAQYMLGDARKRGLWPVMFLFPLIFTFGHTVCGGAEHFLGFFAVPMFVATARALPAFDLRRCALLGVFSGGAILMKYQSIYMIAGCGSLIVGRWLWLVVQRLRRRSDVGFRPLVLGPLVIFAVGTLVSAAHFVKNIAFHRNPLYPFMQDVFTKSRPTHPQAAELFSAMLGEDENHPTAEGWDRLQATWDLFWSFSWEPHYTTTAVQTWPLFGALFILLVPCAFFVRKPARIWMGIWVCFVVIAIWGNTYLTDRYLNAAVPVFAGVTAALMVRVWELGRIARVGLVPLVSLQLVWGADAIVYSGDELLRSTVKLVRSGWAGTLEPEQRYPYWVTFAKVTEATPPDARILLRGSRPSLNLDRTVHLDLQWLQANYYYAPLRNAADLHRLYKKRKISHLLYRKGVHYSGTLQSSVLFAELVYRITSAGAQHPNFRGFELVELPPDPPASREQYAVVVLNIREFYPEGLYRVEDLDVYGRMDRREREKPKPRRSLRVEGIETLLPKADAVLVGRPNRLAAETKALMQKDFVLVESLEAVEIHLRKQIREDPAPEEAAPAPVAAPTPP